MDGTRRPKPTWAVAALLLCIALFVTGTNHYGERIAPERLGAVLRLWVGPIDATGLSLAGARQRVAAYIDEYFATGIELVAGDVTHVITQASELGVSLDVDGSVERAMAAQFAAPVLGQEAGSVLLWDIDKKELARRLAQVAGEAHRPPRNAVLDGDGGIVPERPGLRVDMDGAVQAIETWLAAWDASGPAFPRIRLPVVEIAPAVTQETLRALAEAVPGFGGTRLTGYTTYYDEAMTGRTRNVRLAAQWIDGTVLRPGDVFSFNEIVGPRRIELGFHPAPEIVGEAFVEGVGGGICQVSSTLFNAVLYADLHVVERYRHSIPLGYVPPGRDATLHYGEMDFRFANSFDEPIVIRAEADRGRLRISLWGSSPLTYDVTLTAEERTIPFSEVKKQDRSLLPGTVEVDHPGELGRWIIVSKVVTDLASGERVGPTVVSRNYYPPKHRIVRTGGPIPATREQATPAERTSPALLFAE